MEPDGMVLVNESVVPCVPSSNMCHKTPCRPESTQTALEHITETYQVLGGKSAAEAKIAARGVVEFTWA